MRDQFKIIAFTHQALGLTSLAKLVADIDAASLRENLTSVKENLKLKELMLLSTCNRVEFFIVTEKLVDNSFLKELFKLINPKWTAEGLDEIAENTVVFVGEEAVQHVFRIASSLESLVIGEKEINTQMRNDFECAKKQGCIGEFLKLLMDQAMLTSKEVFTQTAVAEKPISVVSLAYRELRRVLDNKDPEILLIGAGQTNNLMAKYLLKHGFKKFSVYNRTFSKAQDLARILNGKAYELADLDKRTKPFDIIITCTGANKPIISSKLYSSLLKKTSKSEAEEGHRKFIVDLAMPNDVFPEVVEQNNIHYINIRNLKETAAQNLKLREKETIKAQLIIKDHLVTFSEALAQREVELLMKNIPIKIKAIKEKATSSVFADQLDDLDEDSRSVIDTILGYVEKKYICIPMVMAKEVLIERTYRRA